MKLISNHTAHAAHDGDGVNIRRVADFNRIQFDPFLMLDELKSDDESDYIGGFPAHPHRGIETFSYILKGGMEHKDQLGNVKAIQAGDVQWMSTGSGVVHSEMPLADSEAGLHGFQIWLNMPASEKMRAARYQDTTNTPIPEVDNSQGVVLRALAGDWNFAEKTLSAPIQGLAGKAAIADVILAENANAGLMLEQHQLVAVYIYAGELINEDKIYSAQQLLLLDSQAVVALKATAAGAGILVLAGTPIKEQIVHMGPFVMNTQAEIRQAIDDYQNGHFGEISSL